MIDRKLTWRLRNRVGQSVPTLCEEAADRIQELEERAAYLERHSAWECEKKIAELQLAGEFAARRVARLEAALRRKNRT